MRLLFAPYARRIVDYMRDPLPKSDYFMGFLEYLIPSVPIRLNNLPSLSLFGEGAFSNVYTVRNIENRFGLLASNIIFRNNSDEMGREASKRR